MSAIIDSSLLWGVLAGVVGGIAGAWALVRRRLAQARQAGRAEREPEMVALDREHRAALRERDVVAGRLADAEQELRGQRQARELAERCAAELAVRQEEQALAAQARLRDLESARERLKAEFQALAAEILEDKSRRFSEANQQQLGQLLNPLREQLGEFRRTVVEVYDKEGRERVALQTELKQLFELNRRLSDEANSLTRALTTDNRTQGYWGELKLERLLESAGLEKGQQYLTQESFSDEAGDRYRPDALLLLPEDRRIVIDAKVALLDYQRAVEATGDEERERHLSRHLTAVRSHVRGLGEKDYSRLPDLGSPDLVLMFVPVEAAFLEALRRDPELYDFAFARKIILVGPSNLLASLRLIAQIWRTEQQSRNAKLIAERGAVLYDKFVGFVEDLGKVGEALRRAQDAHQGALNKLSQGRGNLVRQAEMLRELGVAPGKRLPKPLAGENGPDAGAESADGDDTGAGDG